MMFTNPFKFDGKAFDNSVDLANYLACNFRKSMELIKNGTLFNFLQAEEPELHQFLISNVSDFEYVENILTLTIYMLDNNIGIVTKGKHFTSNYDIAQTMKAEYPNINRDAYVLFKDKALALIFWNEYEKRNDNRYKRNYTFMLHIYENRTYDFTYFYYLFLHLEKNEGIRFTIDGTKMRNISELPTYLAVHHERASVIIDEILQNAFVLALIAINAGIDMVAEALQSGNKYAILKPLAKITNVNLIPILQKRMAFWLLNNYVNYQYETPEAMELLTSYNELKTSTNLANVADYLEINNEVISLYKRFVELFNYNRIVEFRKGIKASDEFYIAYRHNDEYVCEKFLLDNNLFDYQIHTQAFQLEVEREVLVEALEIEKSHIMKFKNDAQVLTNDLNFNHKENHRKGFISGMTLVIGLFLFAGAYLLDFYNFENFDFNVYYRIGLLSLLALSIIFNAIASAKYHRVNEAYELIQMIEINSDVSIAAIDQEEKMIVNPPKKPKYRTLENLDEYEKNRCEDLDKLKKVSLQSTNVSRAFIVIGNLLFILPFMVISTELLCILLEIKPFGIFVNETFSFLNLVYVAFALIDLILVIALRKKNFIYYLFVILLGAAVALGYFVNSIYLF